VLGIDADLLDERVEQIAAIIGFMCTPASAA